MRPKSELFLLASDFVRSPTQSFTATVVNSQTILSYQKSKVILTDEMMSFMCTFVCLQLKW